MGAAVAVLESSHHYVSPGFPFMLLCPPLAHVGNLLGLRGFFAFSVTASPPLLLHTFRCLSGLFAPISVIPHCHLALHLLMSDFRAPLLEGSVLAYTYWGLRAVCLGLLSVGSPGLQATTFPVMGPDLKGALHFLRCQVGPYPASRALASASCWLK